MASPSPSTSKRASASDRDGVKKADPDSTDESSKPSSTSGSFECNICLDQAKDAVVSMCGHLFCWPCLHRWMETSESHMVCPVCKAAISRDKVIPLYGRGADYTRDPRNKIPPRPAGHRVEPEPNNGGLGGVFSGLFGNNDGGSNFRMSVGIGAFPFGLLTTVFNVGGGTNSSNGQGRSGSADTPWSGDAEAISKLCLFIAVFFLIWLLLA
ncbi:unnamed protein product [Calicophoron daubneyi]|uniref:RING-type E3 ubiquitin transferase n=1 Tax=Calicophoron daubneyi TaxID=300641 RepID=A0AAV2T1T7_CALDB